jgi:hypothetical protein
VNKRLFALDYAAQSFSPLKLGMRQPDKLLDVDDFLVHAGLDASGTLQRQNALLLKMQTSSET